MKHTQAEVNEYITAYLNIEVGKGNAYHDVYVNDELFHFGLKEARKVARWGDTISIDVYAAATDRFGDQMYRGNQCFVIGEEMWFVTEYRKIKLAAARRRDSQRQKVYRWEKTIGYSRDQILSLGNAQSLASKIYADFSMPDRTPMLWINTRLRSYSKYVPSYHQIELHPSWGLKIGVVLHEVTHALMQSWGVGHLPWHGKFFVGLMTYIFKTYIPVHYKLDSKKFGEWVEYGENLGSKFKWASALSAHRSK